MTRCATIPSVKARAASAHGCAQDEQPTVQDRAVLVRHMSEYGYTLASAVDGDSANSPAITFETPVGGSRRFDDWASVRRFVDKLIYNSAHQAPHWYSDEFRRKCVADMAKLGFRVDTRTTSMDYRAPSMTFRNLGFAVRFSNWGETRAFIDYPLHDPHATAEEIKAAPPPPGGIYDFRSMCPPLPFPPGATSGKPLEYETL